jgi:hypothetical protein
MNRESLFYIFVAVGIILFISCSFGFKKPTIIVQQENFANMNEIGNSLRDKLLKVQNEMVNIYEELVKRTTNLAQERETFVGYGPYADLYEGFEGDMGGNLTDEMKKLLKRAKEAKSKKPTIPKPVIPVEDKLYQSIPANNQLQKEVTNSYANLSTEELKKEWERLNKTKYQIDKIIKEGDKAPVALNKNLENNKIGVGLNGGAPINTAESQKMYSKENLNNGTEPFLNLTGNNGVSTNGMQCRFFGSEKCNPEYPNFSGASIGAEGEGGLTCNGTFGSKRATVIASITNGQIKNAYIVDAGKGYEDSPKIDVIGGGGRDAILKGIVDPKKGELISVEIIEPGRGYHATPEIMVDHPGKSGSCYLCCK